MSDKLLVADIILYLLKKEKMALSDYNVTRDDRFLAEASGLHTVLQHIDKLISGESVPDEELKHALSYFNEALGELSNESKGDKHME